MGLVVLVNTMSGIQNASNNLPKAGRVAALNMAKFVTNTIKEAIRTNEFGVPDKSAAWAARSKSQIPLINTKAYLNSLRAVQVGNNGAAVKGDIRKAKLLEGGTKNSPPRPHIRPAVKKMNGQLGAVIGEAFYQELFRG
jgi:HK97 gp10 family phage protein